MAPNGITENKAGAFVSHYMTPPNCARQTERPAFPDCPILKVSAFRLPKLSHSGR
ncbi:hypothetical protein DPMN_161294 [Dreissena polymorpha]|uniref:Uncharacterized protein n=1 Tax=Dreissena polymorpha TaxID=45954 RepID=A0A9D4EN78_DREPO|nr:hypothetical protein DPMN_161294 [Dreissena polymorpha]